MLRRAGTLLLAVAVAAVGILAPTGQASAATALDVSMTCDPVSGTVTAAASGVGLVERRPIHVNFRIVGGSYGTESDHGLIPVIGQQTTIPTRVNRVGAWSATGYTRAWLRGTLFHMEARAGHGVLCADRRADRHA